MNYIFRAFDVNEQFTLFELDELILSEGIKKEPLKSILEQEEGFEVDMYSGKKDINGKPIFSNDIIRYTEDSSEYNNGTIIKGKIKAVDDCLNGFYPVYEHGIKDIEVIGNTYQNSELVNH